VKTIEVRRWVSGTWEERVQVEVDEDELDGLLEDYTWEPEPAPTAEVFAPEILEVDEVGPWEVAVL
jgi:hypothetical protein